MVIALIVAGVASLTVSVVLFVFGLILNFNGSFARDAKSKAASNVVLVASIILAAAACYCFFLSGKMAGVQ